MASADLSPVPYQTQVITPQGVLTKPWQGWIRQLAKIVITASQIDATTAAANAEAAQAAAASSASVATARASDASSSANQAAISANIASASATSANASASGAASSAAALQAMIDLVGAQAYSPDYIADTVNVPAGRQMVSFQRVTIASGGSLQIYGRGRIL